MLVSTEAITIKSRKFRDTSKIVSFYTAEDGMITCIAKGARLPKNKFGSSLEPLNLSLITYYKKPNTDLFLLSKSEIIQSMNEILNSYDKLNIGLSILESVAHTQINLEPNKQIFNLLKRTLSELNLAEKNFYNFFYKFQLELSKIIGYSISFSYFDFNKIKNNDRYGFDVEKGEFINSNNRPNVFSIVGHALVFIKLLNDASLERLSEIDTDYSAVKTINSLFIKYYNYHLGKRIVFNTLSNYTVNN